MAAKALIIALAILAYGLACLWWQTRKDRNAAEAAADRHEAQAREQAAHSERQTRRIRHLQQRNNALRDELEAATDQHPAAPQRPPVLTDWSSQLAEIEALPVTSPEDDR